MLFDPQTAGGLLIAVGEEDAEALGKELRKVGIPATEIGGTLSSQETCISVTP